MNVRSVMKRFGWYLVRRSEANLPEDHLDLSGDRDVEWSWIAANLPENPGEVLDFGPSSSTSGLIAAFHGGKVTGLDLEGPPPVNYVHPNLVVRQGDILTYDFGDQRFDTVINCSTVEHVGLAGRYGSTEISDGDLQAMQRLRSVMRNSAARMVMTVPVGVDGVYVPYHRVYGSKRFPALTSGFSVVRRAYFAKTLPGRLWKETTQDAAFATQGSASFYALGLYVLAPA